MKRFSRFKKKLRSSNSTNEHSPQPKSVPEPASTSQITTPSGHQASGSSLTVPIVGSQVTLSPSAASAEPETVSPPPEESESTILSVPDRLWSKAYNILEEKEPDTVKKYEEILDQVQHEWVDTTAPEELQSLQHCKSLESRQMWRLVYSGLEKSKRQAQLKENISTVIETVDKLKGVVDKAVKYSTEAGIAWAGVSLGLEILSNPMKEPGLNREGIAYVVSRMEWYWNLAELVLQDNSSGSSAALRANLETQITDFYTKLLMFQMRSACLYYRNWAVVILRDAVKLDDWAGELNTIKDAERLICKDIEQYDNQDIRLKLKMIEISAVEQAESLKSICKFLREEARLNEKRRQDDKDNDCIASLLITDPRKDKRRIQKQKGDPLRESYEWILKSDAYQTFMDDPSSRVLWINGPPGKGKTMLLCGIIDELRKGLRPVSFFLCQANVKEEDLSSDIAVMRGLIYVLLEYQPSLMSEIRPSYDKQKDKLFNSINSSELLSDILSNMLQDPSLRGTVLLVDALDECTINRPKLTNLIAGLSKSCSTKWIVSSRDWPEICQELVDATGLISLDLEQERESVSQAVKSFISQKVDDLAKRKWKNDLDLKEKVFHYMQSHADDTFLWVALVCERLDDSGISKRLVEEELVKFPTSLTALYQAMMDRIADSSEADRLKKILALVCVVYRPLKSYEIPTLIDSMDNYDQDDVKDAIACCGSFLTLQNEEIFFVHQSAKEFLLDQGHEVLFPHGTNHKHANIFSRSLEAMENTLRQDIYKLGSPGTLNPVEVPSPDPLCAIKYSCVHWAQHFCKSESLKDPGLLGLRRVLEFFQSKFTNWLEALSLMKELSTAISSIVFLKTTFTGIKMQELIDFINDAHRFVRSHKRAIEISPLQVYCAALIFSPQSSVVRQKFSSQIPEWIIVKPEMENHWDHHIQSIYINHDAHHANHSPDGSYLAISTREGFDVYETVSGNLVHQEKSSRYWKQPVYSPDGLYLCVMNRESIIIFCATTFRLIRELQQPATPQRFFSSKRNNTTIASWGFMNWQPRATQCFFLPETNNITIVIGGDVVVMNWKTEEPISSLNRIVKSSSKIALLNATQIVGISPATTRVEIWDLYTGDCKQHFDWDVKDIGSVACSLDGHRIAAAASRSTIRLWHLDGTLGWVHKHDLNSVDVSCLTFSENSLMLISGSYGSSIMVWDETGCCVKELKGHSEAITYLSIRKNQLASVSWDETVKFWDLSDVVSDQVRQKQRSLSRTCDYSSRTSLQRSYPDRMHSLLFSPTGSMLVSGSPGETHIWDTATDICTDILLSSGASDPMRVSFTPDDKLVAMTDTYGKLGIWEADSLSGVNIDGETGLKIWGSIKDPQTKQHVILPFEKYGKVTQFFYPEDWKVLATSNTGVQEILYPRSGKRVKKQYSIPWTSPLAVYPDDTWILTHGIHRNSFAIREVTYPYDEKDLGSLEADAIPRDTPLLEKPWWRVATRYGVLAVGEPRDFEGTARVGWGLSLKMDWVMRGNERMLWIPAEYRRMALDVNASRVAFVCLSGQIQIMRFR